MTAREAYWRGFDDAKAGKNPDRKLMREFPASYGKGYVNAGALEVIR